MNAEAHFLPHLISLHGKFPKLKIVLEHATTRAAIETVKSLGDTIGCTITAHHLDLTVDDWAGQSFHFCKPVAKYPDDRAALQEVIREGQCIDCLCLLTLTNIHRILPNQAIHASSSGQTLPLTLLTPNLPRHQPRDVRLEFTRLPFSSL